jgi:hypothetical protein
MSKDETSRQTLDDLCNDLRSVAFIVERNQPAALMSVRLKSPPLNNNGSPVAFAKA